MICRKARIATKRRIERDIAFVSFEALRLICLNDSGSDTGVRDVNVLNR